MGLGTGTGWSNLRDGPTCEISSTGYHTVYCMDSGFLLLCTILHYPGACL